MFESWNKKKKKMANHRVLWTFSLKFSEIFVRRSVLTTILIFLLLWQRRPTFDRNNIYVVNAKKFIIYIDHKNVNFYPPNNFFGHHTCIYCNSVSREIHLCKNNLKKKKVFIFSVLLVFLRKKKTKNSKVPETERADESKSLKKKR